jgi:hypothetical protein
MNTLQFEFQPDTERFIKVLAPLLRELALNRKDYGVTAFDTRQLALKHGFATGGERGRELSWLAAVPRAAGLIKTAQRRAGTHRNAHAVYLHPDIMLTPFERRAEG